jgi:hypothetical protein
MPCHTVFVNVTLSLPDDLVREARHEAVDRGLSLSRYLAELLEHHLESRRRYREAQERMRRRMAEGPLYIGEITWTRDDLHER